nr:putative ribonuclease H-like domain-containing protein [Tanacetum cinerariifolium]
MDPCAKKCVFVGYGITQKGYRCYNPKTRHMFTTMNCDFLETEYYYATQHSSQGESECLDTLNWLRYVTCEDERSHSSANESHLSTQPEDHVNVTQTVPSLIPEVSNPSPISNPIETNASWQGECTGTRYANKGWPLHQFDVKNAFLHGELKEKVYMEAPHGFTNKFRERKVCLLKKSLYGLKQSPRAWFDRFTLPMKNHGFKQSNSDHTLFLKQRGSLITYLIIYVDDMIVTGDDKEEITKLKKYLFMEFEMKDLGRLKYFLRNEVLRSKQGIFMCQKVLADKGRYQRMVGKLIYLSYTRPDIAYAVGIVSQCMHQPQKNHMKAVMRILRYLKGTTRHGVLFKPNGHLVTQLYTDADWA